MIQDRARKSADLRMEAENIMKVDIRKVGDITVMVPHGDIRVSSIISLRSYFEVIEKEKIVRLAVDLSHVNSLDSSGVNLIANVARQMKLREGRICLVNYSRELKQLLDITGIDQSVELFDDITEMRQFFR
jgi:anti-anti-sigma factor